jgi:hypothetical protein
MNALQVQYSRIIHALINLEGINYSNGNLGYGLSNYIAKFSLAKDTYKVSQNAYQLITESYLTNGNTLVRSSKIKNGFTYEHPIPVVIIRAKLTGLQNKNLQQVQQVLMDADHVTIITNEENNALTSNGLKQTLPNNVEWNNNNTFIRYETVRIYHHENQFNMIGAIIR